MLVPVLCGAAPAAFALVDDCVVDLLSNSASNGIKSTPTLKFSLSAFSKKIEANELSEKI